MSITKITTPELLDFPNDSTSSANTSGTVIPTGNNYISGGGGLVENSLTLSTGVSYTVTIGDGGDKNGAGTNNDSTSGGNSVFHTITSIGGANATFNTSTLQGVDGGSGAGATGHYSVACTPGSPGNGTINQGYSGGAGYGRCSSDEAGGGGGGAGGRGGTASPNIGGAGGIGIISYIKDPSTPSKYAGGGGGGGRTTGGLAVSGYGGSDGVAGTDATDATANTGGGGGSTGGNIGGVRGGDGGSGVVIVRYPSNISAALTTVSGTVDNAISGSTDLYAEITSGSGGSILFSPNPAGPATTFTADYLVVAGGGGGDMDERGGAGAGGLRTSYGTTRPATADDGEFRYNEQLGYVEYYDGSNWQQIADEYITGQPTTCVCNYPTSAAALYEFQDNTSDTCGNYDGIPNATAPLLTYATGKYGKAAVFNRVSISSGSYVTVPGNPPFARDFSISIWFNPAALVAASYASGLLLMQRGYTSTIGGTGIGFYLYGTELRPWIAISGSVYQLFSAGTLAIDTWYHTVLTRTYNSQWELFLNGTSLGTYNTQGTTADFSADSTFYFGGNGVDSYYFFDGMLDQVRLFSSALNSSQVTELYNEIVCN